MKITVRQLRKIIKEEISRALTETAAPTAEKVDAMLKMYSNSDNEFLGPNGWDKVLKQFSKLGSEWVDIVQELGEEKLKADFARYVEETKEMRKTWPKQQQPVDDVERVGVDRDNWRSSGSARYSRYQTAKRRGRFY